MSLTLAIDTHSVMFRAFYAAHSGGGGAEIGLAIMRKMLSGVIESTNPHYVFAARDPGKPTFRHHLDPQYKGSRGSTPDELKRMIPLAIHALEEAGIPVLCEDGFEADDILATMAAQIKEGHHLVVLSSDRDLVGLVRPGVDLLMFTGGGQQKWVTHDSALEVFGVPAEQVADYKALVGDSSDNIPGVRGIGPKTAVELLQKHGSLEAVLESQDSLPARVQSLLQPDAIQAAKLCKQLAELECQVPVKLNATEAKWDRDKLLLLRGL